MLLDEDTHYRINVFDWKTAFSEVFDRRDPGFDAVIGNSPYVRIQAMKEWAPIEVEHYKESYRSAGKGNYDIYVVFVERGLSLLNKNGKLGYILPHKFFNAKYGESLRGLVTDGKHLNEVVHFGDNQIFSGATTYTALLLLSSKGQRDFRFIKVEDLNAWRISGKAIEGTMPAASTTADEWNFVTGKGATLFSRLRDMPVKLGDIAKIFVGLQTSADTVFLFKDTKISSSSVTEAYSKELNRIVALESKLLNSVIRSGSIGRYWAKPTAAVLFPYDLLACVLTLQASRGCGELAASA